MPPNANVIRSSDALNRHVRRAYRCTVFGRRSVNICCPQFFVSQKNRRTHSSIRTGIPPRQIFQPPLVGSRSRNGSASLCSSGKSTCTFSHWAWKAVNRPVTSSNFSRTSARGPVPSSDRNRPAGRFEPTGQHTLVADAKITFRIAIQSRFTSSTASAQSNTANKPAARRPEPTPTCDPETCAES